MHIVSKTGWGTVVSYLQLIPCRIRCCSCPDHPVPVGPEARHSRVSELAAGCSPWAAVQAQRGSCQQWDLHTGCALKTSDYQNGSQKFITTFWPGFSPGFCNCEKGKVMGREWMFAMYHRKILEALSSLQSITLQWKECTALGRCLPAEHHPRAQHEAQGLQWKKYCTWSCGKAQSMSVCTRRTHKGCTCKSCVPEHEDHEVVIFN